VGPLRRADSLPGLRRRRSLVGDYSAITLGASPGPLRFERLFPWRRGRHAKPRSTEGASVITLSYLGAETRHPQLTT